MKSFIESIKEQAAETVDQKEVSTENNTATEKKSKRKNALDILTKGKTLGGETPNEINVRPQYIMRADGIKEEKTNGKTVVFSFGRMNPPTVGHEKLVRAIEREAKLAGGVPRLYLSRTEGDEKNPLPYSKKNKFAKMAFPIVKDTPAKMMPAGFIGLLKHLEDQFDDVVIVVGSDRLPAIKKLADRYNGTEYKYNSIKVVSAGERDPDEEGVAGMSASKMRKAAIDGDLAAFKAGLPTRLKGVAKTIFDELVNHLNEHVELDEAVLTLSQRLKRRAVMRRMKGKIRIGKRRALRRKATGAVIKRRSKRIAIKMMRKRILRGRDYKDLSLSSRAAVDRQIARRKPAISRIAKRVEPKLRQAESRRKSGSGFKSISLSPAPAKKKLKEEISEFNFIESVTQLFDQIAEETRIPLTHLEEATLNRKSNEFQVPIDVLRQVYDRGVAAWHTGLRENSTPQQWGFARVNSFLANGYTVRTADSDLLEETGIETEDEEQALEKIKTSDDKKSLGQYKTRGSTAKVKAAATQRLKELEGASSVASPNTKADELRGDNTPKEKTPKVAAGGDAPLGASTAVLVLKSTKAVNGDSVEDGRRADKPAITEKSILSVEAHAKMEPSSEEALEQIQKMHEVIISKSDKPDVEYVDAIDQLAIRRGTLERQLVALSKSKNKEKKLRLNEEIKKIKQLEDDQRNDQPSKVTTDKIKEGMPKYDRKKTILAASPEQNKNWETSGRENHFWSLNNNASGTPDRWPGDDAARLLEGLSNGIAAQMLSQKEPPFDLDAPDGIARVAAFAIRSSLDANGNVAEGSYLSSLGGENKKISKAAVENFKQLLLADNAVRINPNKTNAEILSSLDHRQLAQMLVAVGMAGAKRDLCNTACDNLGWDRNKVSAVGFAGSKRQIDSAVSALDAEAKRQKEAGIERPYVLTKSGYMLSIDKAKELIYNAGGGDNSSDCTLMVRNDETGEIMFTQTSDKANEEALFGNSTPRKQLESYQEHIDSLYRLGLVSEEEYQESRELMEKHSYELRRAESEYDNFNISLSKAMLEHANNGKMSDIMEVAGKLSDGPNPKEYLNAVLKHPRVKDRNDLDEQQKLKMMFEHMQKAFDYPEDDKENGLAGYTRDQKEFMKRLTNPDRWRIYREAAPKIDLNERSKHVENITRAPEKFINSLGDVIPRHAATIHGKELADRSHISQYIAGGTNPSGDPAASDCYSMIAGSNLIIPEYYKEEILPGIRNMQEFCEKVKTAPTTIVYDKFGNATGGVSAIRGTPGSKVQLDGSTVAYISETENDRDNEFFERRIRTKGGSFASAMSWSRKKMKSLANRNKARGNSLIAKMTNGLYTSTFIGFNDFLVESADKAVGNVPVINAKPIHHKASGHKYHIHHMMNPDLALKHQVKHAEANVDRDVDSDIDQFDKKTSKLPDEVSVPTKTSTKQFFDKYKKEREHIHAGEPIDESEDQTQTGGGNWYIDATGQKVQVMSVSARKNPRDVEKYLSMKDFLKTQPEKE